ncbi:MAG: DEAD/DEAH box helicase family protein [Rectinemataceae bacterium]
MAGPRKNRSAKAVPFPQKLALFRWMLSLFGVERFEDIARHVRDESLEGLDENNIHRFYHALALHFPSLPELPASLLLEYDQNIVRHTLSLNERRIIHGDKPLRWKYFQYLALLFTEIYLDRYFRDPVALRTALAASLPGLNEGRDASERVTGYDSEGDPEGDLNKLAFWMATGSGKTLLMHANILQYRHYIEKAGRRHELNRIILLTPNEGLSRQHLREFEASGIAAEIFDKEGSSLFIGHSVEILEVTKLKDEMGDKTIAVDAFEGNNLVLVDEGHRGAAAGEEGAWMRYRDALCESGFSFEYSATFAQAVRGSSVLTSRYSRSILFDYSYRYFYDDGFGKDYQILNLDKDTQTQHQELYLTACLLAFFQQQKLFKERESAFRAFHIEKPLWIFVGSKVTASLSKSDASDIIEILLFLSRFVKDRAGSCERIRQVMTQGLVSASGRNLFEGRFAFLATSGANPESAFDEILLTLFNAPAGGLLYVENLKGAQGEIALRIGAENDPFGVINVGDDAKLVKLCEEHGLDTGDREFSGSLFHEINTPQSTVNILIGSKKFTEGWNSWRVSTLGLMNIGATEGAQIIQLFGRGVRLKGYDFCLKRSARASISPVIKRPDHIAVLETLSIFGIHADYMAQFRDFLEEEGLAGDEDHIEVFLPVIRNLGNKKLKTIRLKKEINGVTTEFGEAFRSLAPIPSLSKPEAGTPSRYLQDNKVIVNWYPKIQAIKSAGMAGGDAETAMNPTHLSAHNVAFLDIDSLYFEVERFKAERGWYNFNISRTAIRELLSDTTWYELLIPSSELELGSFSRISLWQEIASALLKKYAERFYSFSKKEWELPHLEYVDLEVNDPNLLLHESPEGSPYGGGYRVRVDESAEEVVAQLEQLKTIIISGTMAAWEFKGMKALWFDRHIYQPLMYSENGRVEMSPVALNKGEREFVQDLRSFCDNNTDYLAGKELYLLRNLSKGRGVGFFEAGNFHPDFIIWLLVEGKQHVIFADPKGLRNVDGMNDPKIKFHSTIKEIERRLGDGSIILSSFILSNTPSHEIVGKWRTSKEELKAHNVLFQEEDKANYIKLMFGIAIDVSV